MKNLVYILVDALSYDNVGAREYRNSPTPFLDELKSKSLSFENMYTQAPYTEAAFVSTLCGENVLDNGGYIWGLEKCERSYASVLKEKNFCTLSTLSPYIMSKSYIKNVDTYVYSRTYSLAPLKLYRLGYFREKYLNHTMTAREYEICERLLDDALEVLLDQLESLQNNGEETVLIQNLVDNKDEVPSILQTVRKQRELYLRDKIAYLQEIFEQWDTQELLKNTKLSMVKKVSADTKRYIEENYGEFLHEVQKKENSLMKKNQKYDWKYILDLACNDEQKYRGAIHTYRKYKELYENTLIIDGINGAVEEKVTISAERQLQFFAEKIIGLDQQKQNYFAFIHLEDFHLPSMYYSYDENSRNVIDRDFKRLEEFVKTIPDNYKGSLVADMSAFYVDNAIRNFFNTLSEQTKNEFVFVVTADHGYPCNYNPPRPIIFNAFYQENYHIPLVIYDSSKPEKRVENGLFSSMDIMDILFDMIDEKEEQLIERPYVLIEYPGPGCPVISSKEIYYAIFDGKYKVAVKAKLAERVDESKVVLVTDVESDAEERRNLIRKIKKLKQVQKLIEIVDARHVEIANKFGGEKFYKHILGED
ncbi:MAG: sulfatase-like hydrolase/transferase [Tyzzerella sp.]|nr:sulfatase-like hydrolase/transferase [Tyzzerella sp.]